jgi:hypothetical protein
MPRIPLPGNRRSTVVAGVAVVTMVASVGASVTGAVRPARSRSGRFYRAPSGISWTAPRSMTTWDTETSMSDAIEIIRAADGGGNVVAR